MAGAVVGGVAGGLLRADVVGPDRDAGMPGPLGDKAADRKKSTKVGMTGFGDSFEECLAEVSNLKYRSKE